MIAALGIARRVLCPVSWVWAFWVLVAGGGSVAQAFEAGTEPGGRPAVVAKSFLVAAGSPLAANAGADIIRLGGTAADAAVAVQMVLGLVEPQSSGVGGGAFLLHYDHTASELTAFDGRETAPAGVTPGLFLDAAGQPVTFYDAVIGGRSVGVPGVLRLLETVHQRYGKLPWAKLLQPAITLAEQGFAVSPRLAAAIAADRERLNRDPVARAYFFAADGQPLAAGTLLKNPAYAETLRKIAIGGADVFYTGAIAKDIVAKVHDFTANPGTLNESDLKGYQAKQREPLCQAYRAYEVCGFPPPASGGTTVGEILGLLGHFDLSHLRPLSLDAVHLFAEASKLAYSDREVYLADPDIRAIPAVGLIDTLYLMVRAQLINPDQALPTPVRAGNPPWRDALNLAPGQADEFPSTSQISIVDRGGNMLTLTTSIEDEFGSRLMVDGFLLNNELTDFSFRPADQRPEVQPARRHEADGFVKHVTVAEAADQLDFPDHQLIRRQWHILGAQRADLHDGSPRPHQVERLPQGRARSRRLKDDIKPVAREVFHLLHQSAGRRVQCHIGPEVQGRLSAGGHEVTQRHGRGAEGAGRHSQQQPDRAGAEHEHPFAGHATGALHRVQRHGKRFHHRARAIVHFRGQLVALVGPNSDVFGERPIGRRGGARTAEHDGSATEIGATALAILTNAAGPGRIHRHSRAYRRPGYALAHGHDVGRQLMPENERTRRHERSAVAMFEVVRVRAADASTPRAQQHQAGCQAGHRAGLDADVLCAVKHGGQHGFVHGCSVGLR